MTIDHVLFIGFGAPANAEDVPAFLQEVTRGLNIPQARLDDVAHHYAAVGGGSPYNAYAMQLVDAVRAKLATDGFALPVAIGMRNWRPFLRDVVREQHQQGRRSGIGVILAPHRSYSSFGKYIENIEDAKIAADARDLQSQYLAPWHEHPLFIEAQADRVRAELERIPKEDRPKTHLLFTAHSIPMEMIGRAQYVEEFRRSSQLVAQTLQQDAWSIAYQSRSGPPQQRWLEPDALLVMRELRDRKAKQVIVIPIGFLFDHIEVKFDLDIEARAAAARLELGFHRASTVMDHPSFVRMFAELIRAQAGQAGTSTGAARGGAPNAPLPAVAPRRL